jgi:hypothetical protein
VAEVRQERRATAARIRPGDLAAAMRLADLADYVIPFAIRVVAELGVADLLADGPRHVDDLAQATGTHAPSLLKTLRALATKEVFVETTLECFALTPAAAVLRTDHPLSLRAAYPLLHGEIQAWSRFDHTVRTGGAAFDVVHGQTCWEYLAEHEEEARGWVASQNSATKLELMAVTRAYDWSSFAWIVDVGGGDGAFLAGLLERHESLRGTLVDLPHSASGGEEVFAAAEVSDRAEVQYGSFFDPLPAGADAYVLKRVLYGWRDDDALRILRNVRGAMSPDTRLLVLEPLVRAGNEPDVGKLYDLLLITMTGGGARSEPELEQLLAAADLRVERIVRTPLLPIVECAPV